MKRYVIAAVLLAAFGSAALAQAPPPGGVVLPPPRPVAGPVMPGGPVAPVGPYAQPNPWPNGYYKSGGVLVGADGNYPYDSGMYLLGGTDTARVTGYFRMVMPPPGAGGAGYPGTSSGARSSCPCKW